MFRVGFGQDSHKFIDDEKKILVLGGVEVPGKKGFKSNSDGDVAIHALCNAIEQAIGNGSLARYSDPMCHDEGITDSREYLKVAVSHMKEKGFRINNVGISIEGKEPKVEPIIEKIKNELMPILELEDESAIGINATTGEEMTPFGKGEGMQAFAIVSLIKDQDL